MNLVDCFEGSGCTQSVVLLQFDLLSVDFSLYEGRFGRIWWDIYVAYLCRYSCLSVEMFNIAPITNRIASIDENNATVESRNGMSPPTGPLSTWSLRSWDPWTLWNQETSSISAGTTCYCTRWDGGGSELFRHLKVLNIHPFCVWRWSNLTSRSTK